MSSFSYALDARAAWALHKIAIVAGNADTAADHLVDAQTLARDAGVAAFVEDRSISPLVADVAILAVEWHAGFTEQAAWNEYQQSQGAAEQDMPWSVWSDDWYTLDGLDESRPVVYGWGATFRPGLEVSRGGGEVWSRSSTPRATLAEAVDAARKMQHDWHQDH